MSNSYQDYTDNFSENVSRMYGYTQAIISHVAFQLNRDYVKKEEAAQQLLALHKTMTRLFEERGEKGAYDRIGENFDKFLYEERADALCKLEAENQI